MLKVLVTARLEARDLDRVRGRVQIDQVDWMAERLTADALAARLADVAILITEVDTIDADLLDRAPSLRAIIDCRGNPVNIDLAAATARGVLVINTPGRNAESVAEVTVALMLMCAHKLYEAARAVANREWDRQRYGALYRRLQGIELYGRTAGLVGLGAVGRGVARRLGAFQMRVLAYDPYVPVEEARAVGATLVDLDTLCQESDFISLHVHVTPETQGMIGAAQFARMKPTAFFINAGRAGAVDEEAFYAALRAGRLAGAGLDVYHQEPLPPDSPLFAFPNVILLPHIAGASLDVPRHQSRLAVDELERLLAGERPRAVVNPAVLDAQPDLLARFRVPLGPGQAMVG
jgi:D-3-phosphoglycerate dehydrogenase